MTQAKGRRLLHLGGAEFQMPAIECAKKMGCFVITVDNRPDNPGHRLADLYVNVSTTDREGVLAVAREHHVDGVMTYGSDVAAPTVCYVAQEMGLPGNPLAAAEVLQRKDLFRSFQRENGLPHPEFIPASSLEQAQEGHKILGGKVVVKAADSSGSKGLSLIERQADVESAFRKALSFSRCGVVVMERFLVGDMLELDGDVLVTNGALAFRHYGHNCFSRRGETFVPCGEIFPGFFDSTVAEQVDEQLRRIIVLLGIRSGCLNFDAILCGGKVHLLEIGLRNGGNYVPQMIEMSTGYDLTAAAVLSALGADVPRSSSATPNPVPIASYILHSEVEGRFEGFDVSPAIEGYIAGSRLFCEIDAHVLPFTRGDRALGVIFFRFPDMETLRTTIADIDTHVSLRVLAANVPVPAVGGGDEIRYNYARHRQLLSPFLKRKLAEAIQRGDKTAQRILERQFVETADEHTVSEREGRKHYEAEFSSEFEGVRLKGVERLYEKVIVVEPLLQCIAHCRYCLRRYYEPFHLASGDLSRIARFIGRHPANAGVSEVLITGGDPFLVPDRLQHLLNELAREAPNVRIARVASRLPVQQPDWVSERILSVLGGRYPFRVEVATQINHVAELFPETVAACERLLKTVRIVYNQSVLLAGVNDSITALVDLCNALRELGIENHYIFHCVPLAGMSLQRVPLARTIELVRELSCCGKTSGRSKPKLCVMTDIGKIALYEGTILEHRDGRYLLQSDYLLDDRRKWNPGWVLPGNAEVDESGYLRVWYADA